MMTEKDTPDAAAVGPEDSGAATPDAAGAGAGDAGAPQAAGKVQHPKPREHLVSPGAESTRELREMARRRREAEEKLQQHLKAAKDKPADG
jgi:hypothetical protein